jgi:hypothetical protein
MMEIPCMASGDRGPTPGLGCQAEDSHSPWNRFQGQPQFVFDDPVNSLRLEYTVRPQTPAAADRDPLQR